MAINQINKKGIFYTILAIVFVSIMVFVFVYRTSGYRLRNEMSVMETRIYSMDQFVTDVEADLEREIYISGFRSLSALVNNIITNGEFLTDLNSSFNEVFMNGTLNGRDQALMNQSKFSDWLTRIQNLSEDRDILVNMTLSDLKVYQSNPWYVNVSANVSISMVDLKETANWTRDVYVVQTIEIQGFEDPLYVMNSYGKVTNIIQRTVHEGNYTTGSGPGFDPKNLEEHANNSWYSANTDAPNFLMRLTNDLSSSPYGIESMVNLEEFEDNGLSTDAKSVIDHIYFSGSNPANQFVNEMPDWFRIDAAHEAKYEVVGETY